jgi:hypothetical protein
VSSAAIQLSPLLLIDDDRSLASLLAEYCAAGGFSITSALSGEDGIRMAGKQFLCSSSWTLCFRVSMASRC